VPESVANAPERPLPTTRLGRSALFVFAAASVGAAACGSSTDEAGNNRDQFADGSAGGSANRGAGGELPIVFYGAPSPIGGAGGQVIGPPEMGGYIPVYGSGGMPPGGGGAGGTVNPYPEGGGGQPMYGAGGVMLPGSGGDVGVVSDAGADAAASGDASTR
jgi:hypothetical protein